MRFRFLYSQGLKTIGLFRLDFGGIFAHDRLALTSAGANQRRMPCRQGA